MANRKMSPDLHEKIFGNLSRYTEKVHVPEWGLDVEIRAIPVTHPDYIAYVYGPKHESFNRLLASMRGRDLSVDQVAARVVEYLTDPPNPAEETARRIVGAVALSVYHDGKPLFSLDEVGELRDSGESYAVALRLANQAMALASAEGDLDEGKEPSEETPSSEISTS